MVRMMSRLALLLLALLSNIAFSFLNPHLAVNKRLNWSKNAMQLNAKNEDLDDDTSTFDALLRFGPAPAAVRIFQPEKYEESVENFMKKEGCSRLIAVRNMDAYFSDPIGWALKRERAKDYGETIDYTRKSGVQKRPVFSFFWAIFVFWFFIVFLPTRITELGGIQPSALSGGICDPSETVLVEGRKICPTNTQPFTNF